MTDHAAEARAKLDHIERYLGPLRDRVDLPVGAVQILNANAMRDFAEAQVQATLAVAAELRTANIIAMFTLTDDDSGDFINAGFSYAQANAAIREALDLS